MSDLKDVKCEKCKRTVAQRRNNDLYKNGSWEHHSRSFTFTCPFFGCDATICFKVNRNDVKMNLSFAV